MSFKLSVCLPILKKFGIPVRDLCREIAAIGFDSVELWNPEADLEDIVGYALENKIAVSSMVGSRKRFPKGGMNHRANHAEVEEDLKSAVELAAKHKISNLILLSGDRVPGQSVEDAVAASAEVLRRVAPLAEKKNICLNLELLNSKIDHPGYDADHTEWGLSVCQQTASTHVKLLYDIYHMQIMEGDIIRTLQKNISSIGHFHAAGNPGRSDLHQNQELDYRSICQAIAKSGFTGSFGLEYIPSGDPIESLRKAYMICRV